MASEIKITFLGTSAAIPSANRNTSSILLDYNKEKILIDCGEGTQRQFRKAKINPMKVTRILISHWHGDHVLGLPGFIQTLALNEYKKTLCIYGPKGTKQFLKKMFETFVFVNKINIKIKEVGKGKFLDEGDFYLESSPMVHHKIPCNAYNFIKKGQIRIDKKKLKKSGLPSGKHLGNLKKGKDVRYKGKLYRVKNLTFMEEEKKISFVSDTKNNKNIVPFVKNSDFFVCESNFDESLRDKAEKHYHMTAKQAAEAAKKSKSKKLVLTHISQRHEKNPKVIFKEAKKAFKNTFIAKDFDIFNI